MVPLEVFRADLGLNMKQVVQYKKNGLIEVIDVPEPQVSRKAVKIRTSASLISAGTERSSVELAEKSLAGKAMARPDLTRKVIENAKSQGIQATFELVRERLKAAEPMGYSVSGIVESIGEEVTGIQPGDLVAGGGVGYANHAEVVTIPKNLVVPVPDGVSSERAAFGTIGAIALQGIRQLDPKIGETFLVLGLGLVGQLTVQLLRANGCCVVGTDLRADLISLAEKFGAFGLPSDGRLGKALENMTDGYGVDGVVLAASTASSGPVRVAGAVTREKGRVVVVGAVGLEVPREPYYHKEIDLKISRSYGPGRYDPKYEEAGMDYPFGYVRFTEQRNMRSFLGLVADGKIDLDPLITHRFPVDRAPDAYEALKSDDSTPPLGILLKYPEGEASPETFSLRQSKKAAGDLKVSFIGAGNYATSKLLPNLHNGKNLTLAGICTATGLSARDVGTRLGFEFATANPDEIFGSDSNVVFICTRHDSHADLVIRALAAGKHVFVEKPLCLTTEELERCREALAQSDSHVLVGFNRRFAPLTDKVMAFLGDDDAPVAVQIRVNAGFLGRDNWLNDPDVGGGRILGEACHFVDLAAHICRSFPINVYAKRLQANEESPLLAQNVSITLSMANGSVVSILYVACGAANMKKEYVEVFKGGRSAVIEDFSSAKLYDGTKAKTLKLRRQDKGQKEMVDRFLGSLGGEETLIPKAELLTVTSATMRIIDSLATGNEQPVN